MHQLTQRDRLKTVRDTRFHPPAAPPPGLIDNDLEGVMRAPPRTEPERAREEIRLEHGLQHDFQRSLHNAVTHGRNRQRPLFLAAGLWYKHPARRKRPATAVLHLRAQLVNEPAHPVLL